MEDAIKKLIDISEKIGGMDAKIDDVLTAQKSFSIDIDAVKKCYAEHSERLTKAEEKISVLDGQKKGVVAVIVSVFVAIVILLITHIIK